ncbi:hypothetical protein [Rhizobium sp. P32RR-XVIII]|uniref:hypothetical protein n=1 Tax=Rhizobium sp. P32RR-XVIII TaxID=2726738 RepID=UPI0028AAE105|nr:hypothetical protein [Rhizobium sp. P32RR-XVIII]
MLSQQADADANAKALDAKLKQDAFARDTQIKGQLADHDAEMRTYEASEKVRAILLESQQRAKTRAQEMQLRELDIRKKQLEVEKMDGQIDAQAQKRTSLRLWPVCLTICLIEIPFFDSSRITLFVSWQRRYPSYCSLSA